MTRGVGFGVTKPCREKGEKPGSRFEQFYCIQSRRLVKCFRSATGKRAQILSSRLFSCPEELERAAKL